MIVFTVILGILFFLSIIFNKPESLTIEKTKLIKIICAVFIVVGHLAYLVDIPCIQVCKYWGAPLVSIFFFLSGFGLYKSSFSKQQYLHTIIFKRIPAVLIPCLVNTLLFFLVINLVTNDFKYDIISSIKSGKLIQHHLWFVYVITFQYLTFYVCNKLLTRKCRLFALFIVSLSLIFILKGYGFDRCWYVSILAFPTGVMYSKYEYRLISVIYSNKIIYSLFIFILMATVGIIYKLKNELIYTLAYVFIPVIIIAITSNTRTNFIKSPFIKSISKISYCIYLCQVLVMKLFRSDLVFVENDYIYCIIVIICILPIAYLIYFLSIHTEKTLQHLLYHETDLLH